MLVRRDWSPGAGAGAGAGAAGAQAHGLLELAVAPVQLLHLCLVLRPRLAQLLQEPLVGADQGPVALLQHLGELLELVVVLQVLLQLHDLARKPLHTGLQPSDLHGQRGWGLGAPHVFLHAAQEGL